MNHHPNKENKNMKKLLGLITLAVIGLIFACASTPKAGDELDTAIRETSDYLNANLAEGNKLVILNIQSDFPALSEYIIDELIANTVNDRKFSVVDRQQLDTIRAELDFQMSGEVDDRSAQEMGRMLGAQTIVSGAVSKMGSVYRLRIRALNVQTAQIEGQFNRNIPSGATIDLLAVSGAGAATTTTARTAQAQPAASAAPVPAALPTYRVGDTGPAGGLIFYDKRNNSGGWRYLEAAPVDVEFQAVWSVRKTRVENTQSSIGSGRRNTQLIVTAYGQASGEWDTAAQKCDDLVFGGFDDWFMPSRDELDQMYGNLKRRNLGDFKNERYWSSTVASIGSRETNGAFFQDFGNGNIMDQNVHPNFRYFVRPIRQVAGPNN